MKHVLNTEEKGELGNRLAGSAATCDTDRMEIVFNVTQEGDGGYVGECLSHDIFTQGDTWEELRANVQEAVAAYFFDQPKPKCYGLLSRKQA
jgi:predicted RNase H-like HicB family nuclease